MYKNNLLPTIHDGFPGTTTDLQPAACFNFCDVARHVLGKDIREDWKQKVDLLISSFQATGVPPSKWQQ